VGFFKKKLGVFSDFFYNNPGSYLGTHSLRITRKLFEVFKRFPYVFFKAFKEENPHFHKHVVAKTLE